jgi:endo-1,4-beta-xylanase
MKLKITVFTTLFLIGSFVCGQNEPVIIEAESGTLGADYQTLTSGDVTYITPQTDMINGSNPGSADKVATFTVVFADSGTYKLFARVRVGSNGANDDSFFYGTGFGTKNPTADDDWVICNQMAVAGFTILDDVVEGQGDGASGVWKWVALSDFTGYETPLTFRVDEGDLTQTFQIGSREDGFDMDKIAFGRAGIYYTVDNLNKSEAGSVYPPGEEPIGPPLAYGLDKFLGCAYGPDSERDFAGYWNQVTPGNGGKWGWVEGTRDNMVWTDLDEAYQLAKDSNFIFKDHTLIWGNQQPHWIGALDSADQYDEIIEWFTAVANRYPLMDMVDVVNEALHDPPDDPGDPDDGGYYGALGGPGVTGWDWVIESFRLARDIMPDTTMLLLNDYSIINSNNTTDNYLHLIHLLQENDSLIDGIGIQGHGFEWTASTSTYLRNLDTLASTGLPIYISEFDLDGLNDLQHVHNYMNIFPLLWEHPAVKGITLWGFRPGMWRTQQGAYLIDANGNERPAMLWLRAYLKNSFVPDESITLSTATGLSTIDTDNETLQMVAEVSPDTATLKTVYWTVNHGDIASIDQNGLLTPLKNGTVTVTAKSLELNSNIQDQMDITISGQLALETIAGDENIRIYPNPVDAGYFTVDGIQAMSSLEVLDINGNQIIARSIINQSSVELNLNVPPGLYIVRLSDGARVYHAKISVR